MQRLISSRDVLGKYTFGLLPSEFDGCFSRFRPLSLDCLQNVNLMFSVVVSGPISTETSRLLFILFGFEKIARAGLIAFFPNLW